MSAKKRRNPHSSSHRKTQLKPLAQAVTLVCAGMAGNSVYADVCTLADNQVTTDVSGDVCILDAGQSLNVTANGLISYSGNFVATTMPIPTYLPAVGAGAIGSSAAGTITNAGTISGSLTSSNPGTTNITLTLGLGIAVISTATLGAITNNGGTIEGKVIGTITSASTPASPYVYVISATGIFIGDSGQVTGGITNNAGIIAGIAGAYIHGSTTGMAGSVTSNASAYAFNAYGILVDTTATLAGGITNSGTIKGHATAFINVREASTTYFDTAYASASQAYGIAISGTYNDGGAGFINNGTISGIASATVDVTNMTTLYEIFASANYAFGAYFGSNADMTGGITNTGMIEGRAIADASATGTSFTSAFISEYQSAWAFYAYGLYLNSAAVGGALTNSGTIAGEASATVHITDFLTVSSSSASGAAASAISAFGLYLSNSDITGGINNSGEITGSAIAEFRADNVLSFTVSTVSYIDAGEAYGIYNSGSTLGSLTNTNTGTISGTASASFIINEFTYFETNSASFSVSASYAYGIYNNGNITGDLDNSGLIKGSVNTLINFDGIDGSLASVYPSSDSFYAYAFYGYGIAMDSSTIGGAFTNSGTISALVTADIEATDLTGGSNWYYSPIASAFSAYGVYLNNSPITGGLTNSGTIEGTVEANYIARNVHYYSEEPYAYANSAYGLFLDSSDITGSLTNDGGTISASALATIDMTANTESASGSASGQFAYGLVLFSSDVGGDLINSGTISALAEGNLIAQGTSSGATTSSGKASAYYAFGLYASSNTIGGVFDNSGSISGILNADITISDYRSAYGNDATAGYAYGVYLSNSDINGGLTNTGTISTISGEANANIDVSNVSSVYNSYQAQADHAYGLYGYFSDIGIGVTDHFTNSGSITASAMAGVAVHDFTNFFSTVTATASYAYGVSLYSSSISGSLTNNGTISADITASVSVIGSSTGASPSAYGNYAGAFGYYAYGLYQSVSDIAGSLTNDGTISATGSASVLLENMSSVNSSIYASAYSIYGIYSYSSDIAGSLTNTGTISAEARATIDLNNIDTVGSSLTTANYLSAIAQYAYGVYGYSSNIAGSLTNSGLISANAIATVNVSSVSSISKMIADASRLHAIYLNSADISGSLINSGTISAEANATINVVNTPLISTYPSASVSKAYGIYLANSTITGALTNNSGGIISASGTAMIDVDAVAANFGYAYANASSNYGIYLGNSAVVTTDIANNGGTVSASGTAKLNIQGSMNTDGGAQVNNIVGIEVGNTASVLGNIVNSGTISAMGDADVNIAGANASAYSYYATATSITGIRMDSGSVAGGLINTSGTISGIANASLKGATDSLPMIVAGSPTSAFTASAFAVGIALENGASIDGTGVTYGLDNSGTILGQATASVAVSGTGFSGYAIAEAVGIFVDSTSTITNGINNSGMIKGIAVADFDGTTGNATAFGTGIAIESGASIAGDINNTGTIEGSAMVSNSGAGNALATGIGILIDGGGITGTIVNTVDGVITGTTSGIKINSPVGSVTVANEGEINGIDISNGTLVISGEGTTGEIIGNSNSNLNVQDIFTTTDTISDFVTVTALDDGLFNLNHDISAITLAVGGGTTGTLHVGINDVTLTGALTFSANSTYKATLLSATTDDAVLLTVTGAGTFTNDPTVFVETNGLTLVDTTSYLVIDSASGSTITPSIIMDDQLGFDFAADVVNGDLTVTAAVVVITDLIVNDGETVVSSTDYPLNTITVGNGTSGILEQTGGTLTVATSVVIDDGGTYTQTGTAVLNAPTITLGTGSTLTLANSGTGVIDGSSAGVGDLLISGEVNTDSAIGANFALDNILVLDGGTLVLDQNANANTATVGEGVSGILNQTAGTLTVTSLTIADSGTYTQSGTGVLVATTATLGDGGALTLANQTTGLTIDGAVAGQGSLIFAGDYDTDTAIGSGFSLASLTVDGDATLTADQDITTDTISISGTIDQTAGILTTDILTINAGGALSQSGTGAFTATTASIGDGGTLTLGLQTTGLTVDGAAAGQGNLVFAGNFDTDTALGATNSLGSITINDGVTLALDQNASATTFTIGQGTSGTLNFTAGTLTATTLVISDNASYNLSGTGVLNAINTQLGNNATLSLNAQAPGAIDGIIAGEGDLIFTGDFDTAAAIGDTNSLSSITVNDGVTLTLDQDATADSFTVGQGTSGVVNHSAGTVTTTTLTIDDGGAYNQSGTGVVDATTVNVTGTIDQSAGTFTADALTINSGATYAQSGTGVLNTTTTTIGSGGTLTLANQGVGIIDGASAGVGDLMIAGEYNTDSVIGGTNALNSILVKDGGALILDQNADASTVTVGEGTSGILNQSAGTLTVTDLIINGGGSYVQSGTGVLNATSTTITLGNGGSLTLANQGTGPIEGAGAGQGNLIFAGDYNTDATIGDTNSLALLTVNGDATLTADQNIEASTITIAGILNQSAGSIGAANLTVNSGATVTQSGTGAISGGSLSISGIFNKDNETDLTANTTINSGGLLMVANGFNHVGNFNASGGTLYMGGESLNIDGTFNLAAGATLITTVNSGAADDAGRITATGATTVSADSIVDILVSENAVVEDGITYTIIDGPDGGGGVNIPLSITDDSTELNFIASTDGDDLILTAELSSLLGEEFVAELSPNALEAFTALQAFIDGDSELANAFAGITTVEEFEQALESLAPDISRAVINVTSHAGRSAVVTIINRLVALRTGGVGYTGVAAGNHMDDVGMWMQAFGSTGDQNDRQGIAGFDADTLGLSFGADTLVSDNLRVGAAFSYANSDVDTKGLANKLDIDNYQGTIYGSYDLGMHYLDASFSYGKNTYDSRRVITVGTVNRIALADFNADQVILQGQYGREYTHADDIYISPYVGLFYANLDIDGYSETGAGTLNLNVDGQSYETLESVLGVSARKEMESRDGTSIMPELHAAWRHEFLDEIQVNTSTYTGGGASFITTGADPANNTFNIGASFSMFLENNVDIKFSYDFDTKSDYKGHSGLINIRYNF